MSLFFVYIIRHVGRVAGSHRAVDIDEGIVNTCLSEECPKAPGKITQWSSICLSFSQIAISRGVTLDHVFHVL